MTADTPLTDAETAFRGQTVRANLFALFQAMAETLPGAELEQGSRFSRHLAFPFNPMFKGVWQTRLAPGEVDAAIAENIAWFSARQAPFFFWWTGDSAEPQGLEARLEAHGLISMEEQQKVLARGIIQTAAGAPCMVADLGRMNESAQITVPRGFTIEEIQDRAALEAFKQVFVEAYAIPEWAGQAWADTALRLGIGKTPWKMYLGRLNGKPVATNMLFNGAGVASVYGVAVSQAARGQGIGGAITLKPLLDARDMGYRFGVLFSSEMGLHAYERIGFRVVEGRINRYLWRSPAM